MKEFHINHDEEFKLNVNYKGIVFSFDVNHVDIQIEGEYDNTCGIKYTRETLNIKSTIVRQEDER